ncbi:hypothetical protein [Dactylosporangium darangshiense]|uniref:Uncharacterized protein n=1 Tax=Dactylosporangium darangshiense TaxID=579108 RepID=A0ABP8DFN5_9ACTN
MCLLLPGAPLRRGARQARVGRPRCASLLARRGGLLRRGRKFTQMVRGRRGSGGGDAPA